MATHHGQSQRYRSHLTKSRACRRNKLCLVYTLERLMMSNGSSRPLTLISLALESITIKPGNSNGSEFLKKIGHTLTDGWHCSTISLCVCISTWLNHRRIIFFYWIEKKNAFIHAIAARQNDIYRLCYLFSLSMATLVEWYIQGKGWRGCWRTWMILEEEINRGVYIFLYQTI